MNFLSQFVIVGNLFFFDLELMFQAGFLFLQMLCVFFFSIVFCSKLRVLARRSGVPTSVEESISFDGIVDNIWASGPSEVSILGVLRSLTAHLLRNHRPLLGFVVGQVFEIAQHLLIFDSILLTQFFYFLFLPLWVEGCVPDNLHVRSYEFVHIFV